MTDQTHPPDPPAMPEPVAVQSTGGVRIASYALEVRAPDARTPDSRPETADVPASAMAQRDILFAHATGFCAAVFAPLAQHLDGFRNLAFDARAHGRSGGSSGDMDWELHRDDVLAVIDAHGLVGAVGVGHSMGAAALLLAEQCRPGTFSALWLFEPIVFPPTIAAADSVNPLEVGALKRRDTFDSAEAAFANFASKPPLNELCAEALSAYVHHGFQSMADGRITLACRPADEAACYRMGSRHKGWGALGSVSCPVLVVRGAAATGGPAMMAPGIADRLPAGRLEEHPELGHFGPLAAPAAMADSIRAYSGNC